MSKFTLAGAAVLVALAATPALAKDRSRMDADGDGRITLQEMETAQLARLMRFDKDGDRRISRAEFDQAREMRHARRAKMGRDEGRANRPRKDKFAKLDRNADGYIVEAEVRSLSARRFARLDKAGTGAVAVEQLGQRHRR